MSKQRLVFAQIVKYMILKIRVPTQVLQSLIKSYICFSICKALQSLIFGVFLSKRSYKVLFFERKENFSVGNVVSTLE